MNKKKQRKIILVQAKMMEEEKWYRSEEVGFDVGEKCCKEWINNKTEKIRNELENWTEEELEQFLKNHKN